MRKILVILIAIYIAMVTAMVFNIWSVVLEFTKINELEKQINGLVLDYKIKCDEYNLLLEENYDLKLVINVRERMEYAKQILEEQNEI